MKRTTVELFNNVGTRKDLPRLLPVDAYLAFERWGYRFHVHKCYEWERTTGQFVEQKTWAVTEETTGFQIYMHWDTRAEAIRQALIKLDEMGEGAFRETLIRCCTRRACALLGD
jgi:hypothetical protein